MSARAAPDDLFAQMAVAMFDYACDLAMKELGLATAPELAERLGISRNTLDNYRAGRPDPPTRHLLRALHLAGTFPMEAMVAVSIARPEFVSAMPARLNRERLNRLMDAYDALQGTRESQA